MNKTAIYLRLSRDDKKNSESESISNQRDFLLDYAKKNDFNVIKIISDDGYTGTSFVRPGFTELVNLIENKEIDTIITKDLSRLGRDYIKTGYYIEQFFPLHNIRYIAVNDGIDTFSSANSNDIAPFKAVFNDMYAKDISNKVRTSLDIKKARGQFIGAVAPYGYKKDSEDKNRLVIDEESAVNVRRIYREFLKGKSVTQIAKELTCDGISTPSQYKKLKATQRIQKGVWNDVIIKRMLTNPTYAGHLTQNRSRKINYKIKRKISLPESEWITVLNTHNPIISQEEFDKVQDLIKTRRKGMKH